MTENRNDKLFYFLAGTGIGAIVTMLFTPNSGQQMRNTLSHTAQDSMDKISQKVDEGRRMVRESGLGKRAGETIRGVVDRGKNVARMGRDRMNQSVESERTQFDQSTGESEYLPERDKDVSSF